MKHSINNTSPDEIHIKVVVMTEEEENALIKFLATMQSEEVQE